MATSCICCIVSTLFFTCTAVSAQEIYRCDFEADDWHLAWNEKATPANCELVSNDPERKFEAHHGKSLRIHVEKGGHMGASLLYRFKKQQGIEPESVYFRYWLRLADDWNPHAGGKLPGISGTYDRAGWGGRPVNGADGWSARGLFRGRANGLTPIGSYVYHMDMKGQYGSEWVWQQEKRGYLENNRWYCIDQFVKLNTPGTADGELRGWVDGKAALAHTGMRFRSTDTLKIEGVWLNVYHGGTWSALTDQHLYIDDVMISSQPFPAP